MGNTIQPAAGLPQLPSMNYPEDKENVPPNKALKSHRPLPLRKRPIEENGAGFPAAAKKSLIRHNMPEDGAKIMCGCKNSKCLKWV